METSLDFSLQFFWRGYALHHVVVARVAQGNYIGNMRIARKGYSSKQVSKQILRSTERVTKTVSVKSWTALCGYPYRLLWCTLTSFINNRYHPSRSRLP
jgi:hypothetical protein